MKAKQRRVSNQEVMDELLFLKPLLVYAQSRQEKLKDFRECVEKAIDLVVGSGSSTELDKQIDRLVRFTQAVVAYFESA